MTKRPWSSVTTILAYLVGSSVVSAITQAPASGPFAPLTTPPMSSLSISTAACCAPAGAGRATAIVAMPIAAAGENRTCRRLILSSLQCPGLSCPFSNAMNAPHRLTVARVLEPGEQDANCDQLFWAQGLAGIAAKTPVLTSAVHTLYCAAILLARITSPQSLISRL